MADYNSINEFAGTGAVMQIAISFKGNRPGDTSTTPYIDVADVKAEVYTPATATTPPSTVAVALTRINNTTFRTVSAVASGKVLRVYRDTLGAYGLVDFVSLQVVTETDLDLLARQTMFVAAEAKDASARAGLLVDQSLATAASATVSANSAVVTANSAKTQSAQAEAAANAATLVSASASSKADSALSTATSASVQAAAASANATSALTASVRAANDAQAATSYAAEVAEYTQRIADAVEGSDTAAGLAVQLASPDGGERVGYGVATVGDALDTVNSRFKNEHRRKVYARLPLHWPGYDSVLAEAGYNNSTGFIYPGAFVVDEIARELFIVCGPSWVASAYIIVYDLDTKVYKGFFRTVYSNGEGGEVVYSGGNRSFYMADRLGNLIEYDMPVTPIAGEQLVAKRTLAIGIYNQFSYWRGFWYIEDSVPVVGGYISRNMHGIYDENFNRIGSFVTGVENTGYITKATNTIAPFLNKRQGFAVGDGFVVCGYGGSHDGLGSFDPIEQVGIKILSSQGQRIQESIMDPVKFKNLLTAAFNPAAPYTRMEQEGVKVLSDGTILSLYVHQVRSSGGRFTDGILITQEMSADPASLDCSSAVTTTRSPDIAALAGDVFPRSTGGLFNPITGAKFTSVDDVCEYLRLTQQTAFGWYAGSAVLDDLDGTPLTSGYHKITNCNGQTFKMESFVLNANVVNSWFISGTVGSRTKSVYGFGVSTLKIQSVPTNLANKFNRLLGGHYNNALPSVLALDIQSAVGGNNLLIGGGSSTYNCATNVRLVCADGPNDVGGTERWRAEGTSWRPAVDNAYSIGLAGNRVSVVFAGTSTINTSDGRVKEDIQELSDAEARVAAKCKKLVRRYQLTSAVEEKTSAGARYHFGVIAQDLIATFASEGLDAHDYALLCYDQWDDQAALFDEETGHVITPAIVAGERYGVRYSELLAFIISAL